MDGKPLPEPHPADDDLQKLRDLEQYCRSRVYEVGSEFDRLSPLTVLAWVLLMNHLGNRLPPRFNPYETEFWQDLERKWAALKMEDMLDRE